ncbi:hypothetical protein [uncultured Clostridium sp.]|jgi:galactokinase/mevalonate kinase-like predicted kinase|uniref:hypothetical protein n=1 Tax=uncultured Clostridium sp. TaxID=59620 RepID=UPI00033EA957|nr:hypothetical protein [uncultured Clostridium sp.]CCZ09483.1 unknown [Odoribacter sp. CAG:788]
MDNYKEMTNNNLNREWQEVIPIFSDILMKYSRKEKLHEVEIDRLFDKIKRAHEEDIKNDATMTTMQKEAARRDLFLTKNTLNHIAKEILRNNHRLIEAHTK